MDSDKRKPFLKEQTPDSSSSDISIERKESLNPKDVAPGRVKGPPRKRSRIACTWCRDRKVRCDASSHGIPCTNCELDQQECVVHAASQNRTPKVKRPVYSRHQPYPSPTSSSLKQSIFQSSSETSQEPLLSQTWNEGSSQGPRGITPPLQPTTPGTLPDVFYTHHTFLKFPGFSNMPQEDILYLDSKGCLRVPGGAILDEFVRCYFLYVHPCLPIINEAEFWRMYYGRASSALGPENGGMSLLVFQAMLFASCPFISSTTLQSAGYSDARTARNTLYKRAKLLYDLNCETSSLFIAQGSLLLSYHAPSEDLHAGSLWLSISIQYALVFNALNPDPNLKTENIKKRLWWSIAFTDRLTALGLGRHTASKTQPFDSVTGDDGVISSATVLDEMDLEDELDASEVYDPETKRLLAKVLAVQCELVLCLGNVLILSSAATLGFGQRIPTKTEDAGKAQIDLTEAYAHSKKAMKTESCDLRQQIAGCKAALLRWSTNAKAALGAVVNSHLTHQSVGLYFGLTFFYYHAARLALSNFEAMTLQLYNVTGNKEDVAEKQKDCEHIRDELEDACGCITDTIKRFLAQGIAQYLPITALPLISQPLLLSALDVKLSISKSQSATRKRRFRYYASLMQVFQARYDGTDAIAGFIQRTLCLAEGTLPRLQLQSQTGKQIGTGTGTGVSKCSSWSELFAEQPRSYLHLVAVLDLALKKGNSYRPSETLHFEGESARLSMNSGSEGGVSSKSEHKHGLVPSVTASTPSEPLTSSASSQPEKVANPPATSLSTFPETSQPEENQQLYSHLDLSSYKTKQAPFIENPPSYNTENFDLPLHPVLPEPYSSGMDLSYLYPMHADTTPFNETDYVYCDALHQPNNAYSKDEPQFGGALYPDVSAAASELRISGEAVVYA